MKLAASQKKVGRVRMSRDDAERDLQEMRAAGSRADVPGVVDGLHQEPTMRSYAQPAEPSEGMPGREAKRMIRGEIASRVGQEVSKAEEQDEDRCDGGNDCELKAENVRLKEENARLKTENANLKIDKMNLQAREEEALQKVQRWESNVRKRKAEEERLRGVVNKEIGRNAELKDKITKMSSKLIALESRIKNPRLSTAAAKRPKVKYATPPARRKKAETLDFHCGVYPKPFACAQSRVPRASDIAVR